MRIRLKSRHASSLTPAVLVMLLSACAPVEPGESADDGDEAEQEDGGLIGKATGNLVKLKNEGAGTCLRRSTGDKAGNGYEVYQSTCDSSSTDLLWQANCSGGVCKYISKGDRDYCLKASSTVKASGGSFGIYAAPCTNDQDQQWQITNLDGGRLQIKSKETARCAYASESEKTDSARPALVQRSCATSTKYRFIQISTGGDTGGGTNGTTSGGTNGTTSGGTNGTTSGGTTNPGSNRIPLPIEVLGPAGTKQTVEVQVDDPSNVTHLFVRCNGCGYHDSDLDSNTSKVKATVSVNGGSPIALKRYTGGGGDVGNRSIELGRIEHDYGGIGGVFRTVRMKVPVSGLVRGKNTLAFEHKTPASPSIGFRIIELNLVRNGQNILPAASFAVDDPATWRAPLPAASDIEQGRVLWNARNRLKDPGLDAVNGSAGPIMFASCADCHAKDGRDLKYFNFSNRSIVERSIFHGLSRTEGERIASYIRSRPLQHVPAARPWNPAYQPGPGLDAQPAYFWAAGAGLNAVLDDDALTKGELFPNDSSISLDDVRRVGSRFGKLNMRELRVALPMPEWNQWLPHIHPHDAFNTNASAIREDASGNSVGQPYYFELYEEAEANPTAATLGAMTTRIKTWLKRGMTCDTNGSGSGEPWRGLNGGVLNAIKLPKKTYTSCAAKEDRARADEEAYELAKRGLSAWISVKRWEILHSRNLEDEGKKTQVMNVPNKGRLSSDNICASRCVDARERGWVVEGRNVFDRPPHFIGHNSRNFYGQDTVTGVAESNAWYHLNMVLSSGYRITMPNHFAYVCSHIEILQDESGVNQGFRFWASMIKQRQLQTNGFYGAETGNDLRTSQPHVYYGANRSGTSETQSSVGQPLWRYFAQAMVEDFVADSNRATRADWEAATGNSAVQAWDSRDFSAGDRFDTDAFQGRNTYRVIPKLLQIGVDRNVVISLKDWGKKTWPNGSWDSLIK